MLRIRHKAMRKPISNYTPAEFHPGVLILPNVISEPSKPTVLVQPMFHSPPRPVRSSPRRCFITHVWSPSKALPFRDELHCTSLIVWKREESPLIHEILTTFRFWRKVPRFVLAITCI